MAITDYIPFMRKSVGPPVSTRSMFGGSAMFGQLFMLNSRVTPRQAWDFYKSVSTFATVVDLIADQVADIEPMVYVDDQPAQQVTPLDIVLARPGYGRTRQQIIKAAAVQELVTGTCHIGLIGNVQRNPIGMDVFHSTRVTPLEGADGWPERYDVTEARRSFTFLRTTDHPLHFRYVDQQGFNELLCAYDVEGDNKGVGLPRLQAIHAEVMLKLHSIIHNTNLMQRGATLSGVLTFDGNPTADQIKAMKDDIARTMAGSANAGGIFVVGGGAGKFESLSQTNKDLDWANLQRVVEDAIANRFNVPATIFSPDRQTYSNFGEAWKQFYTQAVIPCFQRVYAPIARAYSERNGALIEVRHDPLKIDVIAKEMADRASALSGARLITPNEARNMIGYEPIAGGDSIMDVPGLIPVYDDLIDSYGQPIPIPDMRELGGEEEEA